MEGGVTNRKVWCKNLFCLFNKYNIKSSSSFSSSFKDFCSQLFPAWRIVPWPQHLTGLDKFRVFNCSKWKVVCEESSANLLIQVGFFLVICFADKLINFLDFRWRGDLPELFDYFNFICVSGLTLAHLALLILGTLREMIPDSLYLPTQHFVAVTTRDTFTINSYFWPFFSTFSSTCIHYLKNQQYRILKHVTMFHVWKDK